MVMACDFSQSSEAALELAKFVHQACAAELHLVHVFNPNVFEVPMPYHFPAAGASWSGDHLLRLREQGQQALKDLGATIEGAQTHFLEGRPGQAICDFAEREVVDLIILGSHGYGGLDRLILGSVAQFVSCHATCTVITVKPEKHEAGS